MLYLEYLFHEASAGRRACKPERIISGAALRTSSRPARRIHLGHRHGFQSGGCQPDGGGYFLCDRAIGANGRSSLGNSGVEGIRRFWISRQAVSRAYVRLLRAGNFSGRPRQRLTITAVRRPLQAEKVTCALPCFARYSQAQAKMHSVQTVCTELFFDPDSAVFDETA